MSLTNDSATNGFNAAATHAPDIPKTNFTSWLRMRNSLPGFVLSDTPAYSDRTVCNILRAFHELGLSPPQNEDEFMAGVDGQFVFLNRYGLVLRIESKQKYEKRWGEEKMRESPWISKPLAAIDAGEAVVALCGGSTVGKLGEEYVRRISFLRKRLNLQKIDFWDTKFSNIGVLPIETPLFPAGIPIVIDRGAVKELTEAAKPLSEALQSQYEQEAKEAARAEEELYGRLREAFRAAWPDHSLPADAGKMRQFWDLCADHLRQGGLVEGWNDTDSETKTEEAGEAATAYETRLPAVAKPSYKREVFGRQA